MRFIYGAQVTDEAHVFLLLMFFQPQIYIPKNNMAVRFIQNLVSAVLVQLKRDVFKTAFLIFSPDCGNAFSKIADRVVFTGDKKYRQISRNPVKIFSQGKLLYAAEHVVVCIDGK